MQVVPSLRDEPGAHAAVDIALTLLQAGARALVAGENGPLAGKLRGFGAEFQHLPNDTLNPLRIAHSTRALAKLIANERVDIVHAQGAGAAWSALLATHKQPVYLVTSFPNRLPGNTYFGNMLRASLARGDRVIAPSAYVSRVMIARYKLKPDCITVIPRAVDTAAFGPTAVSTERIAMLRRAWGVSPDMRVVLMPASQAARNGQMSVIDAIRPIADSGFRNIVFVFAGAEPHLTRQLRRRARKRGIDRLCRFVAHCTDMPVALAAADLVVLPALKPPLSGRAAAETQAAGRPLVATGVGMLPENLLCPPRMPEELRTGWLVRPGNTGELAAAVGDALRLDVTAYEALGARARQFAEFMFSPPSVAEAMRGVYTSLLARDS
jgi:glycosyltransferase involved in cell wall biosynthesis